jgi:succinate dehydrogenase / fumarate reductase, membrane anchor subunit
MSGGTNLGRVRGLGAAKHGSEHWLRQRITAIGNLILMLWMMASLLMLPGYDHETMTSWLAQPLVAVPMMLLIVSTFWHIRLGLQVLIEDYVTDDAFKVGSLIALNFFCVALAASGLFSIAKIAFTGTPN